MHCIPSCSTQAACLALGTRIGAVFTNFCTNCRFRVVIFAVPLLLFVNGAFVLLAWDRSVAMVLGNSCRSSQVRSVSSDCFEESLAVPPVTRTLPLRRREAVW
jgi:hypothetical protein